MQKKDSKPKFKLATYDELIPTGDDNANGDVLEVKLDELYEFDGHPFKVVEDDKMQELVDSIKEHGVLVPAIVRKRDAGGYEIIAGHRRRYASKLAGKKTMPVVVKDIGMDEATIIMVDSNIQREIVLPSEKAKAYRMKYDALRHQGKAGGSTFEKVGKEGGDSEKKVQRYIYLSRLTEHMLQLVDEKKLGFTQGVELSWVKDEDLERIYDVIVENNVNITFKQAQELRRYSEVGQLSEEQLRAILHQTKKSGRKVVLSSKLDDYFESGTTSDAIEYLIVSLLDEWKRNGGKL